jgi:hypothetical protein
MGCALDKDNRQHPAPRTGGPIARRGDGYRLFIPAIKDAGHKAFTAGLASATGTSAFPHVNIDHDAGHPRSPFVGV